MEKHIRMHIVANAPCSNVSSSSNSKHINSCIHAYMRTCVHMHTHAHTDSTYTHARTHAHLSHAHIHTHDLGLGNINEEADEYQQTDKVLKHD
jgi:hypothetical protein